MHIGRFNNKNLEPKFSALLLDEFFDVIYILIFAAAIYKIFKTTILNYEAERVSLRKTVWSGRSSEIERQIECLADPLEQPLLVGQIVTVANSLDAASLNLVANRNLAISPRSHFRWPDWQR